ncbi:PREDICTED: WAT1-related protein At5g40240-like [Nelumbo nucifera]|uniref:WAT1-related protein n=1 Tax=Nelumbo nucifera TaxID=4432 RepID=A0A1U8Q4X7_NELNU|nr:PREDICTED: WAT1-related protein At5g40240-like [Nelumbo nucifera]
MRLRSSVGALLPFAAMIALECLDVGMTTLSKAALSKGMSHFVFVVYSNALATLILLSSYIFLRKKRLPLTLPLLCKFFLLALVGITVMQSCVYTGISYSSPTLGSAIGNLVPACTFILAVIFRMEKLDLRSWSSQVKIMGTLVSISGALVVTLYKGPSIGTTLSSSQLPDKRFSSSPSNSLTGNNWILGGVFFAVASLSLSIWNTLQAAIVRGYPDETTIVSFYCLFGTIQTAVISLIAERDPNGWSLELDVKLISVVYSAVFGSVITPWVSTWCIEKKGPVFVAMFRPLGIAIAALMGVIFLGDTLHLGSVVGAIIIAAGFYGVIWGQSKEEKNREDDKVDGFGASVDKIPFLSSQGEVVV